MLKYSDSPESNEKWKALEGVTSPEFVDAMKELYSLYDTELVEWVANLYDASVGGFYYSNSARDNETTVWKEKEYVLRPDAESTCQALGFINSSGIAKSKGGNYWTFLPEWTKKQIGDYIYNLQDPDGYFYHEHWGKDIPVSRRGRDLSWSRSMLSALGREPKYPTILDTGTEKESKDTLIPDHLKSKEAFLEYLDSLDVCNQSYSAGNTTSSQFAQIKSQGLADVCIEYYSARQNPKTGLWHSEQNYYGVNGLMKISGIYNAHGLVIPHSREAAWSAIAAITSDEQIHAVVDLWNTWVAVKNITASLRKFGGEDGNKLADEIVAELRRGAVAAVRKTKEKIAPFKKPDHAFSYTRNYPSPISQGMPVCIPGLPEGDMNATVISVTLMVGMIYGALELNEYHVPIFGDEEAARFVEILEEKRKAAGK